ncbi:hypothetical protein K2X96_00295 [Patescibacteria group bacterium]|nr:hypothetical protein [Patescibacteria group bacterium]
MIAFANGAELTYARTLLQKIESAILFPLITLMMGVAVLVFLYGMYEMIQGAESGEARENGRKHILFGVIGFVVMLSALAILRIAANTVGVTVPN